MTPNPGDSDAPVVIALYERRPRSDGCALVGDSATERSA